MKEKRKSMMKIGRMIMVSDGLLAMMMSLTHMAW